MDATLRSPARAHCPQAGKAPRGLGAKQIAAYALPALPYRSAVLSTYLYV
jgi:hypothetical protein